MLLLGTLNSDETTYDLSPKLIDRSFIITYPLAELPDNLRSDSVTDKTQSFSYYSIQSITSNLNNNLNFDKIQTSLNLINRWNNNNLKQGLGIPLGYIAF